MFKQTDHSDMFAPKNIHCVEKAHEAVKPF